jgi:hypothetical protein
LNLVERVMERDRQKPPPPAPPPPGTVPAPSPAVSPWHTSPSTRPLTGGEDNNSTIAKRFVNLDGSINTSARYGEVATPCWHQDLTKL